MVGAWLADLILQTIGIAAFFLPIVLGRLGLCWMRQRPAGSAMARFLGLGLWVVFAPAAIGLLPRTFLWRHALPIEGVTGRLLADAMVQYLNLPGATIVLAGIFDMTDGRVARLSKRVTAFGGFYDSVMDRYSDLCLLIGLLIYYGRINRYFYVSLVAVAMIGSVMVSYTRARAENLIPKCKVGFLERPERVVLIIIGALFDRMAPVLWLIAVLSNITVVHRILFTRQEARRLATPQAAS